VKVKTMEHPAQAPDSRNKRSVAGAVLWAAAGRWGQQLFAFIVFAVLARLLEPKDFGVVALAGLCLSFLTILIDQGVGTALVRLPRVDGRHLSSSFWMALGLAAALVVGILLVAPVVSRWMGTDELAPVLKVLATSLPVAALATVPVAILTRDLRFDVLTKRTVLGVLVGGLAGVLSAILGLGVWSLVVQQIAAAVIGVVFLWTAVRWRPAFELSGRHLKDVGGIATAVVLNSIAWFVCQRADQAIVGAAIGPVQLAVYAMAVRTLGLASDLVCAPIIRVGLPVLSQTQDDPSAFEASFVRLTSLSALLGVPSLVGFAILAPEAIGLLFGSRWQPAAAVVPLLLGWGIANVVFSLFDAAMLARGRTKLYVTMLTLNASTTVVASLVGVGWGVAGVAIAASVNAMVNAAVGTFVLQRALRIRVRVLAMTLAPLFAACAVMALGVFAVKEALMTDAPPWATLAGCIAAGVPIYGVGVYLAAPQLRSDARRMAARLLTLATSRA
jgi:PST family polysaccharide transporter